MKVIKQPAVNAAIRTLDDRDRQSVHASLRQLENWEKDSRVRKISPQGFDKDVYVLNTSDDLRIFFTVDRPKKVVSVIDIAKPSRFESVPVASE